MTLLPLNISPCHNPRLFRAACDENQLVFTPYARAAEPEQAVEARRNPGLALLDTEFTRNWLEDYFTRQARGVARVGVLEAKDCLVSDDWGLALTRAGGFAITGMSGFGWTREQFDYMGAHGHLSTAQDSLALDSAARTRVPLAGTAALLSFPGAYTYGHWITDMCGRLELLAAQHDIAAIDHFLLPATASWMAPFLAAYGVPADRVLELDKSHIHEVERLLVPTTLGQHHRGALPVAFARQVFRRLEGISRTWGRLPRWNKENAATAPLVYVRHTALTSAPGRELANEDALIAVVEAQGGRVLDPLKLPLPAFLNRLREAELVIGLDSSALHNLAMAPADLLVIQTEPRFNMLHASIQEATGKRVGFVRADATEAGSWTVSAKRFQTLIRQAREKRVAPA